MNTTLLPNAGTGANRISCVKNLREMRELHASPRHEIADSLAKFTGTAIAKGSSMKTIIRNLLAAMLLVAFSLQIHAQGILIDQESASAQIPFSGGENVDGLDIQKDDPLLQSFTPTLSAIDFISFEFADLMGTSGKGATVYLNLYEGGNQIDLDTLIGTTASVFMPSGFGDGTAGVSTFDFLSAITLISGNTYYLEPVVASGDNPFYVISIEDTYPNGHLYENGVQLNSDLWFQEGISAVPEPGTLALIGFTCPFAFIFRRHLKLPKLLVLIMHSCFI